MAGTRKSPQREWWATSDALRDVLVEIGRAAPAQRVFAISEIGPGWVVLDNEEVRVGMAGGWVIGRDEAFLVVRRNWHRTVYVPTSAIACVHDGTVSLNVPLDWVASMDWTKRPRELAETRDDAKPR